MEARAWVPLTVWAGPTHAEKGSAAATRCSRGRRATGKPIRAHSWHRPVFIAGLGRFDEARELIGRARALLEEVALTVWSAGPLAQNAGWVELLAGDPAAAERELRRGYDTLSEIGEIALAVDHGRGLLAEAVYEQGRFEEAEELTQTSEESSAPEDVFSQVAWRSVRAKVLARRDQSEEAELLARECVSLAEETDFSALRWRALMSQGEVLQLTGQPNEAAPVFRRAVAVAEEKGDVAAAGQARTLLDAVETARPD